MLRVGIDRGDYSARRNILSAPLRHVDTIRVGNAFSYVNYPLYKLFNYLDPLLQNLHWSRPGKVDLIHLFN